MTENRPFTLKSKFWVTLAPCGIKRHYFLWNCFRFFKVHIKRHLLRGLPYLCSHFNFLHGRSLHPTVFEIFNHPRVVNIFCFVLHFKDIRTKCNVSSINGLRFCSNRTSSHLLNSSCLILGQKVLKRLNSKTSGPLYFHSMFSGKLYHFKYMMSAW